MSVRGLAFLLSLAVGLAMILAMGLSCAGPGADRRVGTTPSECASACGAACGVGIVSVDECGSTCGDLCAQSCGLIIKGWKEQADALRKKLDACEGRQP